MTLQGGAWSLCWLALCRHRSLNLAAGQGHTGSLGCAAYSAFEAAAASLGYSGQDPPGRGGKRARVLTLE